ncbi:phage tail fiber protein [Klebsiella pneumoniae]|uniref:phage tail fiber domain-containing protein n=1 Tax=Klebsiella pneumoniae TaxID=573 RepID=UPI0025521675|nr:phage tail fiber protein [Klebsiella pneumoniae]MEC5975714.1 phage tail fiber protein [Klebsiella pneumoniae]
MTVSTQVSRNEYTGNGATTQYDFTFRILDKSHLLVQTLDISENIVTLTLGTDYTVTGVNRYNGGKVVLTSALPAGYKISIERSTPVTQEASIRNQGGFFPEIHEDALDKLTMLVQQAYGWWSGLSLRKPSWLANYYDALNNRIRNLRDPSQAQDAATKNYVDNGISGSISHADDLFKRTLRVPESLVGMLPNIYGRKNRILAFNDHGDPIAVLPESGSAADVLIELASEDGADLVASKKPYTGTVRRKVSDMLSETISPWDFGCVSDAIFDPTTQRLIDGTDNTSNLQRMFSEAHYHGVEINLPFSGKFASKSLYLHYDPVKNPDWTDRPGRLTIRGSVLGHATGDVERQGTAIFHIPGENSPLISMIGEFSISNPAAMGGYFELSSLNLIGSQDSSDVLLLQGSQGAIMLANYTIKVLNLAGNGLTEATTWETMHMNGLIRGPATGDGSCTGIGLNIKSDGTIGQINMKQYMNVNVMKMGYSIRAGRREKTNGTLGPLVFVGGQTSGADHHGMWLDGGVISFTSIGQQHEGCRKNGIRIDNVLEDGTVSSDLTRTIKFQQTYITGCGSVDDQSADSYGIYIANGDGIELDTPTFNLSRNGIGFDAQNVDNLLIRRPTFRTVSDYGKAQGFGIRSFSDGVPSKRQYLEHPVFNQAHATQIDDKAREIFGRGAAGGRISFSTNTPTPSIIHGSGSGNESYRILNFNNSTATTITNITGGTPYQRLLITFSNNTTTIQHNSSIILQGGKDVQGMVGKTLELYYTGSVWHEVGDPVRALSGTSANRPFSTAYPGMEYFDTTLGKPIWRNAANNAWVDSAGNVV